LAVRLIDESINTCPRLRSPLSVPTGEVPVPPEIKLAHPDKLAAQSNVIVKRFNTWQDSLSTNLFNLRYLSQKDQINAQSKVNACSIHC